MLLVDDEPLVRSSTADMLTDLGYEVIEVSSAEEALRLLDSSRNIDGLITDHLMPGMTGMQLARIVGMRPDRIPVLLISGYSDVEGVDTGQPLLAKPFVQADLAASLSDLLNRTEIVSEAMAAVV